MAVRPEVSSCIGQKGRQASVILVAERASSGSWGDAEGVRVAHVVHAPGEVVVLVV